MNVGTMLYAVGGLLAVLILIYWMFGMMATTVVRWAKKPVMGKDGRSRQPHLTVSETVKCYIPLLQACETRRALYRSYGPFAILSALSIFCIVLRLVNVFILPINSYVMFATIWLFYLGILLHFLVYGIVTADCLKLYGFSWLVIILGFLFPFFIGFFMKTQIPNKMLAAHKEETFHEHKDTTYIKQKPNK